MEYFLYILENDNGKHYIGISADINKRLKSHNAGHVRSTRSLKPWKVVCTERFPNRLLARKREVLLKTNFNERNKIFTKLNMPPSSSLV